MTALASVGNPPWHPVPEAEDVDVWDKYDFPLYGTYQLGSDLIVFRIAGIEGERSCWQYARVPPGEREAVTVAQFETSDEFSAWLETLYAGPEAISVIAENFVITEILA